MRLRFHVFAAFFTYQRDGNLDEIADDLLDVAADIADFGELGRFHLDEGSAGELGKTAGNFRLATPVGPIIRMFFGMTSSRIWPSSCWRRQRLRKAMATARLASFWPMMKRSSSETISRGEKLLIITTHFATA
jgi:hypothetical protein